MGEKERWRIRMCFERIVASLRRLFSALGVKTWIAGCEAVAKVSVLTLLWLEPICPSRAVAELYFLPPLPAIHPIPRIARSTALKPYFAVTSPPRQTATHASGNRNGANLLGCVHVRSWDTEARNRRTGALTTSNRRTGGGRVRRTSVGLAAAPTEVSAEADVMAALLVLAALGSILAFAVLGAVDDSSECAEDEGGIREAGVDSEYSSGLFRGVSKAAMPWLAVVLVATSWRAFDPSLVIQPTSICQQCEFFDTKADSEVALSTSTRHSERSI